jgi:hypothetical protein
VINIKLIICEIALRFRWKSKLYADWYTEEMQKAVQKAVDEMDIDVKDITFTKTLKGN